MKKGNMKYGPVGLGKTTRMKEEFNSCVLPNERCVKRMMVADEIADVAMCDGLKGLRHLAESYTVMYIDDIGHEPLTVTTFGTVLSPVKEFIKMRYRLAAEFPSLVCTHFTTNLKPEEIKERYGDYVMDRLVEMCEWEELEGKSFRT